VATYSHSKLNCFEQCPRKYYYKYIARITLPDVPEQIAMFLSPEVLRRALTGTLPPRMTMRDLYRAAEFLEWRAQEALLCLGETKCAARAETPTPAAPLAQPLTPENDQRDDRRTGAPKRSRTTGHENRDDSGSLKKPARMRDLEAIELL